MSKRGGDSALTTTKVKKRKGVGFRIVTVLDSDEEDLPRTTRGEYARVTKTRVGASGKAERVSTTNVPILEVEQSGIPAPLEENVEDTADTVVEKVIPTVPAKQPKKVNDSVSDVIQPHPSVCIILTAL